VVTILAQPRAVQEPAAARPARGTLWQLAAGITAAVVAAAVGLAVLCAGTVLLWATGPQSSGSGAQAPLRAAASLWLFALRIPMHTADGPIRLAPLAVTALIAWAAVRAAGWAARITRAHETGPAVTVVLAFTITFTLIAALAARGTAGHGLAVATLPAVTAAAPFAVVTALAGVARHTWALAGLLRRTRPYGAMCLRAVGASSLVLFAGGTVVVVAALVVHRAAVAHSFAVSGGGWSGGVGLALLCLCYLPTAACWAVAIAAGPGIALATDARLDLGGTDLGAVPNLPLVHALPGTGSLPWVAYLTVAVPLLAGITAGWAVRPAPGRRWYAVIGAACAAGGLTGLLAGGLAEFSGGGVGGRLDHLGPSGLRVGPALAVELGFAAAVTAALRVLVAPRTSGPVPAATLALVPRARSGDAVPPPQLPAAPAAVSVAQSPATSATQPAGEPAALSVPVPVAQPAVESVPVPVAQPAADSVTQPATESAGVVDPPIDPDSDGGSETPGPDTPPDLEDIEDTLQIPVVQPDPPPPVDVAADVPCGQQASIASSASASAR
jgi:hypothetical protein